MSVRKLKPLHGAQRISVQGRESLQIEFVTPDKHTVKMSIHAGSRSDDGREYIAIDLMHDPATDIEFGRPIPQSTTLIGRLPKKATPMGIMSSSADWPIGSTEVKTPEKA